ncbi:signal peptidase I [Labilibacter marinus]|uniref:signal peptidase I n=1 Tax=Labilibacter marinus TaxID=1477105 RepID=UPI000835E553|nr:signal peptidase I [Labilibacter marinus]
MKKSHIFKWLISLLFFVLGIWSKSILPFVGIAVIAETARSKSYCKSGWYFIKMHLGKRFAWVEWIVAILFAFWILMFVQTNFVGIYTFHTPSMHETLQVGDVLLVNKLVPGPRHGHNHFKSYSRSIGASKLNYKDVIVFNFPDGDTLLKSRPTESYHYLKRLYGKGGKELKKESDLRFFEIEDRPRFVKRVYGLPGDTIKIERGICFANSKKIEFPEISIDRYIVEEESLQQLKKKGFIPYNESKNEKGINWEMLESDYIRAKEISDGVKPDHMLKNFPDRMIFPFNQHLLWNMHHMGPIYIPKKGDQIKLSLKNLGFYRRAIETFEENKIQVRDKSIFINDRAVTEYTFKMDYYWVIGDNRPYSFDSRFWGFVPENHIIGRVDKVLLSRDMSRKNWIYFRKDRFLKKVE